MGSENIEFQEKKGKKFGFVFALIMSFLIAFAIIFTTFYSTKCITLLMKDFKEATTSYNNFITTTMVKSFARDTEVGDRRFSETSNMVYLLKNSRYIKYAFAYDIATNRIVWSSEREYLGLKQKEVEDKILPLQDEKDNLEKRELQSGNYNIIIGLYQNKVQSQGYKSMFNNLKLFVILFLLTGVVISAFMSKMINRPLMELVVGVQEFGKGHFTHKLKDTGFEEIDKLVDAYNHMAGQLNDLYESLEAKVEDRTKELEEANKKLKETQTMMVHSEKMRSLGELVAGIAHEINNPINFIYGNIMILDNYQKDLITLVDKYTALEGQINQANVKEINDFKQKIDIEFLKDDINDLIKSCLEGVERTKNIILDLKNFSRMDEMIFSECNIPKEIDTTLNILNNKIKNRITVHKNYEQNLPKIEAYGGQINQVFMNILDNAQGAIKGVGDIFITIKREGDNIAIQFEDTGCGIKQENINKIFEPFYTTKPVGQGTGLGMSIAYRVIEAHNGKISVESEIGKGTKVTVILPIDQKIEEENNENKETING